MSVPATSRAYVAVKTGEVTVQDVTTPTPGSGEILIKTLAVAINPTDWKHRDFLVQAGYGLGCDFAGTVVALGAGVTLKVGDRVAGFVHGGNSAGQGSFAEYIKTEATLVWVVPENVDDEEAAAMGGVGPHTAVQALFMKHGLAPLSAPLTTPEPFLIWGASSSVGIYAIQLAKLAGYTVVATASPKNHELLKSYGATSVYDYSDAATPAAIKATYPTLSKALDGIAEKGTTALIAASLGAKGGKIVTLLPVQPENQGGRADVEVISTLAYTTLGKQFTFPGWATFPAAPEDKAAIEHWLSKEITPLVKSGKLRSNPLWRQTGGLAGVNAGMDLLKSGAVSAQKITLKF